MTVTVVRGDATIPVGAGPKIIAHVCNDVGGWGKGFVRALSRRWPEPERAYREWHRYRQDNDFGLGAVQLVAVADDISVANMVAQHGIRWRGDVPPIRYPALEECLTSLARHASERRASVHMPRIGCGLAGGEWIEVEEIITRTLGAHSIATVVYDLA